MSGLLTEHRLQSSDRTRKGPFQTKQSRVNMSCARFASLTTNLAHSLEPTLINAFRMANNPRLYKTWCETSGNRDKASCDIVYCDGACKGNGSEGSTAGIGVWWGMDDSRYDLYPFFFFITITWHL